MNFKTHRPLRLVISLAIGWFGSVVPLLMAGWVQTISWGLRLVFPVWFVHGSFAILLLLWISLMITLLQRVWTRKTGRVTIGHGDHRLATPRPFPIRPKSMISPIATTSIPLKDETPPNEMDAQQ